MMKNYNYENKVALFLDILDFKNIINRSINHDGTDNLSNIKKLYDSLQIIRENLLIDAPRSGTKRIIQFSDSIVISFDVTDKGQMFNLLSEIHFLCKILVKNNILCRGGIAYGKLYHDDKFIFGPAFINAYLAESKAALYPRIILDKSLLNIAAKYCDNEYNSPTYELMNIFTMITKDTDEMLYVDYIEKAEYGHELIDFPKENYIMKLSEIILNGLKNDSPDLKVKYGWMQNKFNKLVSQLKKRYSDNFFSMTEPEFAKFCMSINEIK